MPNEDTTLMNDTLRNLLREVNPKALPIAEFRAAHSGMPAAVRVALSLAIAVAVDADLAPYFDRLEDTINAI